MDLPSSTLAGDLGVREVTIVKETDISVTGYKII